MKTPFGNADFSGIRFGVLGDIIGRPYEAAFFFLTSQQCANHPMFKECKLELLQAARDHYPFEEVLPKWQALTDGDVITRMFSGFRRMNVSTGFSDDTVLSAATAEALASASGPKFVDFANQYHAWGNKYPHAGYGPGFKTWIKKTIPTRGYGADTNGSAMRVGPIGYLPCEPVVLQRLAKQSAETTHNSTAGIFGATIVAHVIHKIRHANKTVRKACAEALDEFFAGNPLGNKPKTFGLEEFDYKCLPTVRHCLALLLAHGDGEFDDLMKQIIHHGGDTDTFGMICGSIYGAKHNAPDIPAWVNNALHPHLDTKMQALFSN